ncbi:MAG: potassium channel protein [Desulfomonile sp.]|nr:potassium channel protein [Desulfomonile sp.]
MGQAKYLYWAFVGIGLILLFGTTGYRLIEGWSLLDCLYMTVITLTTVGFGEIHPLTPHGRVFTIMLIFFGMGVVAYAFVSATRFVVEGEILALLTRRRHMRAVERIHDHFIVCGFGRMGSFIAQQLHDRGIPFVLVEDKPEVQEKIIQLGYLMSPGDATEEETLKSAGINNARGLVAALNSDAENLYTVLTARELNPSLEIVARASDDAAQKKLMRAGATRVISPYKIGGMRMVMGMLKPTVTSFLEVVMDHTDLSIEIEEIQVGMGSQYAGKRLVETDIRRDLDLIVIGIEKHHGEMVFNPGPQTVVEAHDTLIAMGRKEDLAVCRRNAAGA